MDFRIFLESDSKQKLYDRMTSTGIEVRRGERKRSHNKPFATDVGDFGRGVYYTSNYHQARTYGSVTKSVLKLKNPLVLTVDEAYKLSDQYQTVRLSDEEHMALYNKFGRDRTSIVQAKMLENAEKFTKDMIAKGHDGLIVIHKGRLEIVDYSPYIGS
jgi:hypothetical protein